MEKFLTFFLRLAGSLGHAAPSAACAQCDPIAISSISVGELANGSGCIGVTLGSTELVFQIPLAELSQLGQTLFMVGTAPDRSKTS